MAREHFWAFLKDQDGRPLVGSDVRLYLAGTADEAIIYSTPVSSAVLSAARVDTSLIDQSTWVTGASGFFDFYVGNEWEPSDGYSATQQFDLKWADITVSPSAGGRINYLPIFDFIFPVDETFPQNTGKNKMVSNTQAETWTSHIDLTYAHEIHDWRGIAPSAGTELTENRLVSDLLMNTLNEDLDTLLTCGGEAISITASGSLVDVQTIGATAWSPSADGSYFADVTHNLVRNWMFPIYQIYNTDTRDMYWPKNIKDIDLETIRVWSNVDDINLKMTIVGEIHSTVEIIVAAEDVEDDTYQILVSEDDGRGQKSGVSFTNSSTDIYLGSLSGLPMHAFFRFDNVDIPKNAIVTSAKCTFNAFGNAVLQTIRTNLSIEAADDSTQPTNGADLVGRPQGSAYAWDSIPAWSDGVDYDTLDFAPLLQTHFARAGWARGNALTVHIIDDSSDGNRQRVIRSYDHTPATAGRLIVSWNIG